MIEIPILFESREILVVDKPVGISIHNGDAEEYESDLISLLLTQLGVASLFPVHRLDKETSGLQLFALSSEAASTWAQEFQNDKVSKLYEGITRGTLKESEGTWRQPVTDRAEGRMNPAGLAANRIAAETRFKVLASNKFFSRCRFQLITGRQHQIRKHCAMQKHALVGDRRYGEQVYNRRMVELYRTERMFLHSSQIEIRGQTFISPAPPEFDLLLKLKTGS